jgi:RNA polymerase sigma-70 factor (ECF subfamily)
MTAVLHYLFADGGVVGSETTGSSGNWRVSEGSVRADVLDLVREGNPRALEWVMREYSSLVYGVALRITGSEADARDVSQDVFLSLPQSLQTFDVGNFAGWLKVVSCRRALMLLRSERRQSRCVSCPAFVSSLEERTLSRIAMERALGRLHPMSRAVFLLKEVEGFTHKEIADAMGISRNQSEVRLCRARRALKGLLQSP